jgi:hypothetical protein
MSSWNLILERSCKNRLNVVVVILGRSPDLRQSEGLLLTANLLEETAPWYDVFL